MLGKAVTKPQLVVMLVSAIGWELLRRASIFIFRRSQRFEIGVAKELAISVVGTVHAIVASALCLAVLFSNPPSYSVYDEIALSQITFAISAGYFAWDILFELLVDKTDLAFLIHAIACFLCYLFGQYPFLNYYGVYFLLFELSTPLLHLRKGMLVLSQKGSRWFPIVEAAFGITFVMVRLVMGIPMSVLVWLELLKLQNTHAVHSYFVVYYYLAANTVLCGLNIFWAWGMIRKRFVKKPKV
jgi:hypothetical protein